MTVHQHPRPMPNKFRMKTQEELNDFVPYNEAFVNHLGTLDLKELVDRISNEGEEQ